MPSDAEHRRLRRVLGAFLLILAVPTLAIVWQAFDQLKFEAFYQHRLQAEALTRSIDSELSRTVREAEQRSFADFAFLNVAGTNNLFQRSPLAAYPVADSIPGALGYFQVDAGGSFSTPLLPDEPDPADLYGIPPEEFAARSALARTLRDVLAENQLVNQRFSERAESVRSANGDSPLPGARDAVEAAPQISMGATSEAAPAEADADAANDELNSGDTTYSQQRFDDLIPKLRQSIARSSPTATEAVSKEDTELDALKRADLFEIEEEFERKSEARQNLDDEVSALAADSGRARRVEQVALPQSPVAPQNGLRETADDAIPITTFESEIDPYYFRLLDSGHFVLFRNVWRDEQRFIQGVLIDRDRFLDASLGQPYRSAAVAEMSGMHVGYYGDILSTFSGDGRDSYPVGTGELRDTLLFSRNLSAPFDGLELVYSVNRLPLGPGARVLGWTSGALATILVAGLFALYRLGSRHIQLAQQQQDFVSAVSHELKTPLTSIRMYGEMLSQGWVNDDKKNQYYSFIQNEAERLSRLIANVLRLSRLTRSDDEVTLQPHAVSEVIKTIEDTVKAQIERTEFDFAFTVDDGVESAVVSADLDALCQVFINLIDNALKFSSDAEEKRIDMRCQTVGESVLFSVRDFGPGIPQDQLKKIFQLFYRSESELTRETVGTGIGLAIVQELVSTMGGSVDVMNKNPGSEFRVTLPSNPHSHV